MAKPLSGPERTRRKFLRIFPDGFTDEKYIDWERDYKQEAHNRWNALLNQEEYFSLLRSGKHEEIARRAVTIESRTNLLFSFEKMALRDALRLGNGARAFAEGLCNFLHGKGSDREKFDNWRDAVAELPRRQTRVLTWPLLTVFGFIAQPEKHFFLKPMVTRLAAEQYGFEFYYRSAPTWETYESLLKFAKTVRRDLSDLKPRDMIDIQSFVWVQGSTEYEE